MSRLLSTATVTAVGLTCKAVINLGFCDAVTVNSLHILQHALEDSARSSKGQGLITVSNHISTLDDPVTWGILPTRYYLHSRTTRWALGASDIMFTNPLFSAFFRLGQTLETFRGKGIYQPAVDTAIHQLNKGGWVHLYGEGKVNQPNKYSIDANGVARLPRFKWGVGRIIMDTTVPPVVIPMWLTGFDHLMPEKRPFPNKFFPRPGAKLSVTFGNPIPSEDIRQALGVVSSSDYSVNSQPVEESGQPQGWLGTKVQRTLEKLDRSKDTERTAEELTKTRIRVTDIVHDAVESLGHSVSGKSLFEQ